MRGYFVPSFPVLSFFFSFSPLCKIPPSFFCYLFFVLAFIFLFSMFFSVLQLIYLFFSVFFLPCKNVTHYFCSFFFLFSNFYISFLYSVASFFAILLHFSPIKKKILPSIFVIFFFIFHLFSSFVCTFLCFHIFSYMHFKQMYIYFKRRYLDPANIYCSFLFIYFYSKWYKIKQISIYSNTIAHQIHLTIVFLFSFP